MSARSVGSRRITSVAAVAAATIGALTGLSTHTAATTPPPTSTIAATTATTTAASPETFPGPAPRESSRVASPLDIEKIRATSLPLRRMGVGVAIAIALLAIAGFVYGRVRSRTPPIRVPKLATAGPSPAAPPAPAPGSPLPPPPPIPLPPPVVEDAVADTVIFEPPPSHHAPQVIAAPPPVPADVVESDAPESTAGPPGV